MTPLEKDGLVYAGSAAAGALLAKSFGAKFLGLALGGFGGLAVAAFTILHRPKSQVSGEYQSF